LANLTLTQSSQWRKCTTTITGETPKILFSSPISCYSLNLLLHPTEKKKERKKEIPAVGFLILNFHPKAFPFYFIFRLKKYRNLY